MTYGKVKIAQANAFDEIIISRISIGMRKVMQQGFQYSIYKSEDSKYIEIVQYSKDHNFDLYIDKHLMKVLLVNR